VNDSSESGHGRTDTRRKSDGTFGSGVGEGIFCLYTNASGEIVGYTWSTFANSDYYDQTMRNLVVGRLDSLSHWVEWFTHKFLVHCEWTIFGDLI